MPWVESEGIKRAMRSTLPLAFEKLTDERSWQSLVSHQKSVSQKSDSTPASSVPFSTTLISPQECLAWFRQTILQEPCGCWAAKLLSEIHYADNSFVKAGAGLTGSTPSVLFSTMLWMNGTPFTFIGSRN